MKLHWCRQRGGEKCRRGSFLAGLLSFVLLAAAVVSFFLPALTGNWVYRRCKEETERIALQIKGLHINTINSARRVAYDQLWREGQKTQEE